MSLPSRINLVTLGVANIAASTEFYESLGWTKSSSSNEKVTFFHSNGTVLGLFGRADLAKDAAVDDSPTGFSAVTLAVNFESEEAVDAAFDHAIQAGGRIMKKPEKVFWGGYSGYFADPDGHLWELAYNPYAPLDVSGNMVLPD